MNKTVKDPMERILPQEIIYVPSGESYLQSWKDYDKSERIPAQDRYELLKEAVKRYRFGVADTEVRGMTIKTYDTMEYLGFKDSYLCLGTDNIAQMKRWYRYEELLANTSLLVFKRGGFKAAHDPEVKEILKMARSYIIVPLPYECTGVSSTLVRKAMKDGDIGLVQRLVPVNVYAYLVNEGKIG